MKQGAVRKVSHIVKNRSSFLADAALSYMESHK